ARSRSSFFRPSLIRDLIRSRPAEKASAASKFFRRLGALRDFLHSRIVFSQLPLCCDFGPASLLLFGYLARRWRAASCGCCPSAINASRANATSAFALSIRVEFGGDCRFCTLRIGDRIPMLASLSAL